LPSIDFGLCIGFHNLLSVAERMKLHNKTSSVRACNNGSKSNCLATSLPKFATGIPRLDESRAEVCGSEGCGKTLFAAGFRARGAVRRSGRVNVLRGDGSRVVRAHVVSLGFDLAGLAHHKKLLPEQVRIERGEIHTISAPRSGTEIKVSIPLGKARLGKRVVPRPQLVVGILCRFAAPSIVISNTDAEL
jgi:hypothetical protein